MTHPSDISPELYERADILADRFRHIEDDRELIARVLMHGPNDGFQCVGQDFIAVTSAAGVLTTAKDEMLPQFKIPCQPCHGNGLYGSGAEFGQQAFRISGKLLKQRL